MKSKTPFYNFKIELADERLTNIFFDGKINPSREEISAVLESTKQSQSFLNNDPLTVTFYNAFSSIDWSNQPSEWYFPISVDIAENFRNFVLEKFSMNDYINKDSLSFKQNSEENNIVN